MRKGIHITSPEEFPALVHNENSPLTEFIGFKSNLIFLAGPIQGTYDWQKEAKDLILAIDPSLDTANPRREKWDFLNPQDFSKQIAWETEHLQVAYNTGCILFWLPFELDHDCSRAYAQTTRYELGKWANQRERKIT